MRASKKPVYCCRNFETRRIPRKRGLWLVWKHTIRAATSRRKSWRPSARLNAQEKVPGPKCLCRAPNITAAGPYVPAHRGAAFGRCRLLHILRRSTLTSPAPLGRCPQGSVFPVRRKDPVEAGLCRSLHRRVRFTLGLGTSAANLAMKSGGRPVTFQAMMNPPPSVCLTEFRQHGFQEPLLSLNGGSLQTGEGD
jgi:hypothetical protein